MYFVPPPTGKVSSRRVTVFFFVAQVFRPGILGFSFYVAQSSGLGILGFSFYVAQVFRPGILGFSFYVAQVLRSWAPKSKAPFTGLCFRLQPCTLRSTVGDAISQHVPNLANHSAFRRVDRPI